MPQSQPNYSMMQTRAEKGAVHNPGMKPSSLHPMQWVQQLTFKALLKLTWSYCSLLCLGWKFTNTEDHHRWLKTLKFHSFCLYSLLRSFKALKLYIGPVLPPIAFLPHILSVNLFKIIPFHKSGLHLSTTTKFWLMNTFKHTSYKSSRGSIQYEFLVCFNNMR